LINKDPHKWKSRSCKGAATKKWITKLSYPKESFFMLQTFPNLTVDWSGTGVNVPAPFYRTVTADYRTIYKEIKNQDEKY